MHQGQSNQDQYHQDAGRAAHQHGRVAQQGAGEADALALAAGQVAAAGAARRVQPVGSVVKEALRRARGRRHLRGGESEGRG